MQKQYTIIRTPRYYRYKENSKKKILLKNPENSTVTLIENNSDNKWDKKNGATKKIEELVGTEQGPVYLELNDSPRGVYECYQRKF